MKCIECSNETDNPRFCSRSCAAKYNNKSKPKRLPQHQCKNCGKFVNAKHRYCSVECKNNYHKYHHRQISKSNSESVVSWRQKRKEKAVAYLGNKCSICGYDKCIATLEFHHKDPLLKEFQISAKITSYERLIQELDKCILVCANCHREIHNN
jgi:hypothetical protein